VDRNRVTELIAAIYRLSLPHGGVDRNRTGYSDKVIQKGRSLTGAWIETEIARDYDRVTSRSLTGAWIETPPAFAEINRRRRFRSTPP
jgi:hypothetical protein